MQESKHWALDLYVFHNLHFQMYKKWSGHLKNNLILIKAWQWLVPFQQLPLDKTQEYQLLYIKMQ